MRLKKILKTIITEYVLVLELLYHKYNHLIVTVVYGRNFLMNIEDYNVGENFRGRYYFLLRQYNDEIIINIITD